MSRGFSEGNMGEITLALGGGGVKGIAHIGVLRRLEKEGLVIKAIAGTSAGGIVGALYACGFSVNRIEEFIKGLNRNKLFFHRSDESPSFMGLGGFEDALRAALGEKTFDDLEIPFACTAVDLESGQEIILAEGRIVEALLATIAVPGIFPAKLINGIHLIDGGILDPVPAALAKWLAPTVPVVAVCLTPVPEGWGRLPIFKMPSSSPIPAPIINQIARLRIGQAFQSFLRSMDITSLMLAELRLQIDRPDVIIRPSVERFGLLDDVNPDVMIALGETATELMLPHIHQALSWHLQVARMFRKAEMPGRTIPPEDEDTALISE
jgi:NTE family protein